jgi:hypothetical protein
MRQTLYSISIALILAVLITACSSESSQQETSSDNMILVSAETAFFQTLSERCGDVYYGESVFPDNPEHELYGASLKMTIESCTETELRIPFQVNEDRSRTWILTLSDEGLLFKHDHRYDDGTPHDLTNYGGWAAEGGSPTKISFPADEQTAEMLPEAVTNVWTMELDLTNNQFTYFLERHSQPRYKAVFSLN